MARTTPAKVEGVLNRDYDYKNRPSIVPYIDAANDVVTRLVAKAAANGVSISSTTAELIERWLSAHYYTRSDATHTSRSNLGVSASFARKGDEYKQTAVELDPSGLLAGILSGLLKVDMFWLGKPRARRCRIRTATRMGKCHGLRVPGYQFG